MKKTTILLIAIFALTACNTNKKNKLQSQENAKMTLTTNKAVGEKISLKIDADADDQPDVWIDLNNNGVKDAEEADILFGSRKEYPLAAQTITIHGPVKEFVCLLQKVTALDVSKNSNLTYLVCSENKIQALDVSKNSELTDLICADNKIKTLDVSKNSELTELNCYRNEIQTLDLSKNSKLIALWCHFNQIQTLDVSKNSKLIGLWCQFNQIQTLDVSKNSKLTMLDCSENKIKTLDLSKNSKLTKLFCSQTEIQTLDISKNSELTEIHCSENKIQTLDVSKHSALRCLDCSDNPHLSALNVANGHNKDFEYPYSYGPAFNATSCPKLKEIKVDAGFASLVKSPPYNTPGDKKQWKKDPGANYVE